MNTSAYQGQPAQVEARLAADGQVYPTVVHWREGRYPVSEVGRQWQEQIAGQPVRAVLVRLSSGPILELRLYTQDWIWRAQPVSQSSTLTA